MSDAQPITSQTPKAVVFDVGNVLFHWDLRALFEKVITDSDRLEHFLGEVLTFEFHSRHDEGEGLDVLTAELLAKHPEYAAEAQAYVTRFNETIIGPVEGMHELAIDLAERGIPVFGLTNFGSTFWQGFRPVAPIFDLFSDTKPFT